MPVFLARRSDEPIAAAVRDFHLKLIEIVDDDAFRNGAWSGCECKGLPDDPSFQNIIASSWTGENQRFLIVVNFSETASRGTVELPWKDLGGREWRLADALSGDVHQRDGDELLSQVVDIAGIKVLAAKLDGVDAKGLRDVADKLKDKLGRCALLLAVTEGSKVGLVASVSKDMTDRVKAGELVNFVAQQVGGKGGGRPDMAMAGGTDASQLPQALASVPGYIQQQLG